MSREVDRLVSGLGRYRLATGARTQAQHRRRLDIVDRLIGWGHRETLVALRDGRLTWFDLEHADLHGRLRELPHTLALRRPWWEAAEAVFGGEAEAGNPTAIRYLVSFRQLLRDEPSLAGRTVEALLDYDWRTVARGWARSGSDWNHLRRAISRLVSRLTYKGHPLWAMTRDRFPVLPEAVRKPEVSIEQCAELCRVSPVGVGTVIGSLVLTGLRRGEWFRWVQVPVLRAVPPAVALEVRGGKNRWAHRSLVVAGRWSSVLRTAASAGVSEGTLREELRRSSAVVGITPLRLHDLRHLTGQYAARAGIPEPVIGSYLGHSPRRRAMQAGAQTPIYTHQEWTAEDAERYARFLEPLGRVLGVVQGIGRIGRRA